MESRERRKLDAMCHFFHRDVPETVPMKDRACRSREQRLHAQLQIHDAAIMSRSTERRPSAGPFPLHRFSLEDAAEAHAAVESGAAGKVRITVGSEESSRRTASTA